MHVLALVSGRSVTAPQACQAAASIVNY